MLKKTIIILFFIKLILILGLWNSKSDFVAQHIHVNKHEKVSMLNDSIMLVSGNMINISSFLVPHPDSVDIQISDTSIVLSDLIRKDDGTVTTKRQALIYLGKCFYHDKTLNRQSGCVDCHDLQGSGTGFTNKTQGGGKQVQHRNILFEWWTGNETYVELDKKPFKNFSVLNAHRLHENGTILSHALEFDFPLEGQVGKAMEAHFVGDAPLQSAQVPIYNRLSYPIFGRPVDDPIYRMAISAFEQTLTTYDNNINKIARGESNTLYYAESFIELVKCNDCHSKHNKSKTKAKNPVHQIVKATGLDLNNAYHKGYFHTSDRINLTNAVAICAKVEGFDLPKGSEKTIAACIRQNLTDKNYL